MGDGFSARDPQTGVFSCGVFLKVMSNNKLLLVGVGAVVVIMIIVVVTFIQNHNNAVNAERMDLVYKICDASSEMQKETDGWRNSSAYDECLLKGEKLN